MDEVAHQTWEWWMPDNERNKKAYERACNIWLLAYNDVCVELGTNPTEDDLEVAKRLYGKLVRLNLAYYRLQVERANGLRTDWERKVHEDSARRIGWRIGMLDRELERYGLHIYCGDMYIGLACEDDAHFIDIVI